MSRARRRPSLAFLAWAFFFLCVLEFAFFRNGLWYLPDETAWAGEAHYHFEHALQEVERQPRAGEFRVLVVGSSVALYSVLPAELEHGLRSHLRSGRLRLHLLAHQGMTPLHLRTYLSRLLATRPDLIIYPLNPIDLKLERPVLEGWMEGLYAGHEENRAETLAAYESYLVSQPEFKEIAPFSHMRYYWRTLHRSLLAQDLLAGLVASYRYRDFAATSLGLLFENRLTRGRSYLYYAGVPVWGGNVTARGWTGREFSLPFTAPFREQGLLLEAPPGLHRACALRGIVPHLSLEICDGRACKKETHALTVGWQTIPILESGNWLKATLSCTFHSEEEATELGVRLARNAGRSWPAPRDDEREPRSTDDLYAAMNEAAYRRSFEERLLNFERPGMQYLHSVQIARGVWAGRAFDPELPAAAALREIVNRLQQAGVPLLLINSPENPLSMQWHGSGPWYRTYKEFLGALAEQAPGPGRLLDLDQEFRMQDFYDYHHLTYGGARAFGARVESALAPWLRLQGH